MRKTESTTEVVLSIARQTLDLRAAIDGYNADAYDAEGDPEGYVTSLLNALQQWSHVHGIDWDKELARAQGFFEQDLAELEPKNVPPLPPPSVSDLRCPKCGQHECFAIEVTECLLMFADGTTLHGDTGEEWGDWSYCRCHDCQHMGTVYQFRSSNSNARQKGESNG